MIVIPMAGSSSRFFRAQYTVPKYQLPLGNSTVFEYSVSSFKSCFDTDLFVFICLEAFGAIDFVKKSIARIGITNFKIVVLEKQTRGQAETVNIGLKEFNPKEGIFIFNIDSHVKNFEKSSLAAGCDGYLQVFEGEGSHWSFVLPGNNNRVLKTVEKVRISNLCSNGLYYFNTIELFNDAFGDSLDKNSIVNGEFYIAPLYNYIIDNGGLVVYEKVPESQVVFCGTPEEYEALNNSLPLIL